MQTAGVETVLVGSGDGDDHQLLVESQLLEALDHAPDPFTLAGNGGEDRHLLHVVDEQGDRLALEATRDVADGVDVGVRARPGDEDEAVGVGGEAAVGFVEERVGVERLAQGDRAGGDVADALPELVVREPGLTGRGGGDHLAELARSSRVSNVTSSCS